MKEYVKIEFTPKVTAELEKLYEKKISNSTPANFQICWTHTLDALLEIDRLREMLEEANEDAAQLARELALEQNKGFTCAALRAHQARIKAWKGEE